MFNHPLHTPPTPVALDSLESDLHAVNQEIDRVAYVLHVDLRDSAHVNSILQGAFPVEPHHGEHLELLRGLLFLRGKIRQNRLAAGLPDGPSPLAEHIYALLQVQPDDE
jgi:hypothetical protein